MHTLVVGAGFSGSRIALQATQHGSVCATRRTADSLLALNNKGIETCVLDASHFAQAPNTTIEGLDALIAQCEKLTHLVICVAPERTAPLNDAVQQLFCSERMVLPRLQWVGYLSTIGVYGNHDGNWVDEKTPCTSVQVRSQMRSQAEAAWRTLCDRWEVPMACLRLSGIYGPGRSAIDDALAGRARLLIKPGQVFNRIHVDDLAAATVLAAQRNFNGILNITDDNPAPPQDVVRYAHSLVGKNAPEAIDFSTAQISDMARSFYSENKRVSNALSKHELDFNYQYPTYIEGLDAIWRQVSDLGA